MASNVFQTIINQMKESVNAVFGVLDEYGSVIACNDASYIGNKIDNFDLAKICAAEGTDVSISGKTFRALISDSYSNLDYAAFINSDDKDIKAIFNLICITFNECKVNYDEKHNKSAFIKSIISDNILPGDVYVRAKELHFSTEDPRSVISIRQIGSAEVSVFELVQKHFPDKQEDFVLSTNETDVVVIKKLNKKADTSEAVKYAKELQNEISSSLGIKTIIGISTVSKHLRELADRYKESQVAIDVGNIFDKDKFIIRYDSLGLGRIIYQLPTTLCEMFLNEVFKMNPIEALDEDTLDTINRFFENNLNVSETSRKLYVHRNTLVYRLEKIKKLTGLDLREFDHAIVFKVAMMVKEYLDSLNVKY